MSNPTMIDARLFRATMGRFATGVTVVTVLQDGLPHAMTANAFLSVSLDPPLVLVSVDNKARMNTYLRPGVRYGINMLTASQDNYSRHFSGRPIAGLEVSWLPNQDPPLLEECIAHVVAHVVDIHPAGDHTLYIGHVEYLQYWERHPLIFFSGKYKQIEAREPMNAWHSNDEGW